MNTTHMKAKSGGCEMPELASIDFETELIGTDIVNFDYLMELLANVQYEKPESRRKDIIKQFLAELEANEADGDESAKERIKLLEKFVKERYGDLPKGLDSDEILAAFMAYKKGLEKEEVKEFAERIEVEETIIEGILNECRRSGTALMSACCKIKDYVKGGFGKKRSAIDSMVVLAQRYAVEY